MKLQQGTNFEKMNRLLHWSTPLHLHYMKEFPELAQSAFRYRYRDVIIRFRYNIAMRISTLVL
jgi:hypothetical protein